MLIVYAIGQAAGRKHPKMIKIGVTRNIKHRMSNLQTGNPYDIELLMELPVKSRAQAYNVEKMILHQFKELKVRGEWLRRTKNLTNYLAGMALNDVDRMIRAKEKHEQQVLKGHFKPKVIVAAKPLDPQWVPRDPEIPPWD